MAPQLPELFTELADLADAGVRDGGNEIDLDNARRLIGILCSRFYGGYIQESDYRESKIIWEADPDITSRSMLPLPSVSELSYITSLLRKTTLYSDLTVLVCPHDVTYLQAAFESHSLLYSDPRPSIAKTLKANAPFSDLVKRGRCIFLPKTFRGQYMQDLGHEVEDYSAPMIQAASQLDFLPLNTTLNVTTPGRDLFLLKTVVLPYFPNADLSLIADVASKETDSFSRFTHFLARRIAEIGETPTADDLERLVAEIEDEVTALRVEAKKLSSRRVFRGVEVASFGISIAALVLSEVMLLKSLAGVAGSATLLEIMRGYVDSKGIKLDLKKSQFYIPYMLEQS